MIVELNDGAEYTVAELCRALSLNPSSYYKWKKREKSASEILNEKILAEMINIYEEHNKTYGYRRIMDEYNETHGTQYNEKRFHRLAKLAGLQAIIRRKKPAYQYHTEEQIAENILARDFTAKHTNEKWLTDVTEMTYGNGQKLYLSAILDLKANDIVAYAIGGSNNNHLVFTTLNLALEKYPDAHPLIHSDRGFQYTSKSFKLKLHAAGMVQSMSRKGKCIDNGPMEGFWGILKAEMYHLNTFDDYESLERAIEEFIDYYNNKRRQRRLDRLPPLEYRRRMEMSNKKTGTLRWIPVRLKQYFCYLPYLLDRERFKSLEPFSYAFLTGQMYRQYLRLRYTRHTIATTLASNQFQPTLNGSHRGKKSTARRNPAPTAI